MPPRSILIIPPNGIRTRPVRVRLWLLVAVLVVLSIGFAGYFIPFNDFALDVTEKNQKRNLSTQNARLQSKIRSLREMLSKVQEQVVAVEVKKEMITGLVQLETAQQRPASHRARKAPSEKADDLIRLTLAHEMSIMQFARAAQADPDVFSGIPIVKPFVVPSVVVTHFGPAKDPFTGATKSHEGVDLVADKGALVVAPASGLVTSVENSTLWGLRVRIEHAFGFSTLYAHLGSIQVAQGRRVKKGDAIGALGGTGTTTGPHLHYEVWRNQTALDPEAVFFPHRDDVAPAMDGR